MIPSIEEIFHMLSEGRLSFDEAEQYVREHLRLAANSEIKLRDYFAGLAMQSLLDRKLTTSVRLVPQDAYQMANAMLEARKLW
jgi:hypothetical protein